VLKRLSLSVFPILVAIAILLTATILSAEIPKKINYQARLTDPLSGEPLAGSYEMEFRLFDAGEDGSLLWSETQTVDVDSLGIVSAVLGSDTESGRAFDEAVWLEVVVEGEVLTPRREIVSVPFAFHAAISDSAAICDRAALSDSLAGYSPASYVPWDSLGAGGTLNDPANPVDWTRLKNVPAGFADGTDDGLLDRHSLDADDGDPVDALYVDGDGKVGIGTSAPSKRLEVRGDLKAEVTEAYGKAIIAEATATGSNTNYGGYFVAQGDSARAVYGEAPSTSAALHYGGYFKAGGPFGRGVYGEATESGTSFAVGGHFVGKGDNAEGVWGIADAEGDVSGTGGYFSTAGDRGKGVFGVASSEANATNYGGYFLSWGSEGRGVYGRNLGSKGMGVYGSGVGTLSIGVYGISTGNWGKGVVGKIQSNDYNAVAVTGDATGYPNAYAGVFKGRVSVQGTLSKTGGTFVIDHPGDPENKILRHSFVESPEMLLIYKGRARLDEGAVTVDLPGYFEALVHPEGREIVLTCVGGYTPLYLDGEIADGRFTVRTVDGGLADQEFSWIVYGTRNDAWAKQNPVIVEEDKTTDGEFKVGRYLNPEAFGIAVRPAPPRDEAVLRSELPHRQIIDR